MTKKTEMEESLGTDYNTDMPIKKGSRHPTDVARIGKLRGTLKGVMALFTITSVATVLYLAQVIF